MPRRSVTSRRLSPSLRGRLLRRLAQHHLGQGAAAVALKLGRHGLYLRTAAAPERLWRAAGRLPIDPHRLDRPGAVRSLLTGRRSSGTTGAGDSTVSGFLAAVCRGADPEAAVTAALATGACSTEAVDATQRRAPRGSGSSSAWPPAGPGTRPTVVLE